MNIKTIILAATISLTVLPGVSNASACTDAMQNVAQELNDLNAAYASGNGKLIHMAELDYFAAVQNARLVCTNDWIGEE